MTGKPVVDPGWVTTQEAAEKTGYSAAYLRQLAQRGIIPSARAGRDWLINLAAALDYRRGMDALGSGKHNPWRGDREDLAAAGRGRGE